MKPHAQTAVHGAARGGAGGTAVGAHPARRTMILGLALAAGPPPFAAVAALAATGAPPQRLTLTQALDVIHTGCDPRFLDAVRASGGQLLYRGEQLADAEAVRLAPPPDLLIDGTYDDPRAAAFFRELERSNPLARAAARPSNGHIGVARLEAAAAWGEPASIWPLGRLHYAWPADRPDFWPLDGATTRRGAAPSAVVADRGLSDALALGREVLFATEGGSTYVAVRAGADDELRQGLGLL